MAKKKRIAAKKQVGAKKKSVAPKKNNAQHNGTLKKGAALPQSGPVRLVIHTRDITKIMGINIRTAQRLLKTIKDSLGREKDEYVSVKEFSKYVHLDAKDVQANLVDKI
jgi:hypothetical protein